MIKKAAYFVCAILLIQTFCSAAEDRKAFEINKRLGRGVNLGNALEASKEGEWGVVLKEEYFKLIKQAGFNSVRVPIMWSAHSEEKSPYRIDPNFFKRIDWVIKNARSNGLYAIINMHHYNEIYDDPNGQGERFIAIWQQIAEHYKQQPQTVLFEFLNEPCKKLDDEKWNRLVSDTLKVVRRYNPDRIIVIGPTNWNGINKLDKLRLPETDRNIIVSCHYYSPFQFTHQGASWAGEESNKWLGTKWTGTEKEKQELTSDFGKAAEWGKKNNRPINIGEFGAYSKADMPSRILWTAAVAREAEKRNFSWAYWEFCAAFGVYDKDNGAWREGLLKALIPDTKILVD